MQLNKFKNWLKASYSKNTATQYFYNVKRFIEKYKLSEDNINKYVAELVENNEKETQNQFIKSIRKYCEFLEVNIRIPKQKNPDKKCRNYIEETTLKKEIIPIISILFKKHFKVELILKFLFYTGLRKKELINLKREDIDLNKKKIIVRSTKGNVDRSVPLTKELVSDLKSLFAMEIEKKNALNISNKIITNIFEKINKQSIININIHAHLLRHSCAKYMLSKGLDISYIQKILGHKKIETTQIYVNPDEKMILDMFHKIIG